MTYIQSLVFGGVDGIITSFAVVAAIAGAGYSTYYILAIGIANLIADGLSMGELVFYRIKKNLNFDTKLETLCTLYIRVGSEY